MRFLSALLAPRAKPAPDRPARPDAAARGSAAAASDTPAEWQDTRSYLDSVLTQIAAANEALAHSRFGAEPAFADTEPAAMEPQPAAPAPRSRIAAGPHRLEGLEVSEVDDADTLLRLFEKTR
jgi:hypothetical protein